MKDMTNQQLLSAIRTDLKEFDVKFDVSLGELETKLVTKIDNLETRLTNRIASNHSINVKHHLTTRSEIGGLHRKITTIRDGLAKAAGNN